ncbi:hypothetical protein PSAB_21670 [Paenibacillus sabinae T27]|uniref:Uncharacterized protein n=1 Tax=Paenibacillus sabinae T27 TaxID=1268072 RepID=X5A4M0_9BACL|nr:hypothetical protein PSAB_21670 [Paenibacillus sabinae T27]
MGINHVKKRTDTFPYFHSHLTVSNRILLNDIGFEAFCNRFVLVIVEFEKIMLKFVYILIFGNLISFVNRSDSNI